MKPQERVNLINKIAFKLQKEKQFIDIKNYLFAFGINCKEQTASSNSKRVFVQEVLGTIENDIIINIAKDLKLINEQDLHVENTIKKIYESWMAGRTSIGRYGNYYRHYEDIHPKALAHLFAYFHFSFNSLFKFMTPELLNKNYSADQSRELIEIIKYYKSLTNTLIFYKSTYIIEDRYKNAINESSKFLSDYGGSRIPEDFQPIELIENKPIFYIESTIKIKQYNFETKLIGEGSYAKVLKYKDEFYNKYFAVKKANKDLNEKELERFNIEFETMKKANSPYILEVYNYKPDDNSYIMEYADITLLKYIEQNNTKLNQSQRINIVNQIFKAFEYIHENIGLHRDISTTNILLKKYDNDLLVVKISDFGLVKLKESTLTSDNTDFKGSLNDPKLNIIGGFKNYSIEHETYALTRLIYFIITGKKTIDTEFDNKDFELFIQNGISDDFTLRYKNIQEMKIVFNKIKL
ncbi:MAG: protein kinase family protein [Sulfurimonas sp.]|uniref:protein kinase family protein n=1 Tax=Sulfurimonas sp. TaxID=2022749 RepID=UPI003D0C289C